ncbi:hypothetical protein C2W64_02164 [Brevibacillus laterosporus]|nr:hypothetical protein C2W64_02164 [Brevibacillus laterosporus]
MVFILIVPLLPAVLISAQLSFFLPYVSMKADLYQRGVADV